MNWRDGPGTVLSMVGFTQLGAGLDAASNLPSFPQRFFLLYDEVVAVEIPRPEQSLVLRSRDGWGSIRKSG